MFQVKNRPRTFRRGRSICVYGKLQRSQISQKGVREWHDNHLIYGII